MPDMTDFDKQVPKRAPKVKVIDDIIIPDLMANYPDKYEALMEALSSRLYSAVTIERVLQGWGYEVSATTIKTWRRNNA